MKIHDWHVFFGTDAGKYCLCGLLPTKQYEIFCGISDILRKLMSCPVSRIALTDFYPKMIESMCLFELEMPETELAAVVHSLVHIYTDVIRKGPSNTVWMYMFERYYSTLTRKIHRRAAPELCMINAHSLDLGKNVNSLYINIQRVHVQEQGTFQRSSLLSSQTISLHVKGRCFLMTSCQMNNSQLELGSNCHP